MKKPSKKLTLRFYMDNPEHQKAWGFLLNRDQRLYQNNADFVSKAIVLMESQIAMSETAANIVVEKISTFLSRAQFSGEGGILATKDNHAQDESTLDWDFLGDDEG